MYKCKHCKKEVTTEKRAHSCAAVRSVNGKMDDAMVIYMPAKDRCKSKQALQPGYMKRFGSTAST